MRIIKERIRGFFIRARNSTQNFFQICWMISCLLFFGAYLGFFAIWNQRWTARFTKWVLSDDTEARLGYYFVTAQFKTLQWSFEGLRPSELDEFVSTSTNISQFAEQQIGRAHV